MALERLAIEGFRGFAATQEITLALPDGRPGSGLTILIGPNSGGKSTVLEAIRYLASYRPPSFREGRRNDAAGSRVNVSAKTVGQEVGFRTVTRGGSETEWLNGVDPKTVLPEIFGLPSRRHFNPYFSKGGQNERGQFSVERSTEAE